MVKAKKNINYLIVLIIASVLIIAFLETHLSVCVNIRKTAKMVIPFFNGRRELIVNIFIGIFGSSVVGMIAFIIEFLGEKKDFCQTWGGKFLREYVPLLVNMGKGNLQVDEFYKSKISSDLNEIYEIKKYMKKEPLATSIWNVLCSIKMIFDSCMWAKSYIDIADNNIRTKRDDQEDIWANMYPDEQMPSDFLESFRVQSQQYDNEEHFKEIEIIEEKINRWKEFRAEMENRIEHNLREVLVGNLYHEVDLCCIFAGYPITELTSLHEIEIDRRKKAGETTDNQVYVFTKEDIAKVFSIDDEIEKI